MRIVVLPLSGSGKRTDGPRRNPPGPRSPAIALFMAAALTGCADRPDAAPGAGAPTETRFIYVPGAANYRGFLLPVQIPAPPAAGASPAAPPAPPLNGPAHVN